MTLNNFLSLSFLICKMGALVPTSYGDCKGVC